jgi:hypothetical protein
MNYKQTMTGTWTGEFSYGPEYGADLTKEKVSFVLKLIDINKQFEGECTDEQGVGASSYPASIRGFVEGNFISFIKQYPVSHYLDEEGETHLDYRHPHPEIHYTGYYNESTQAFAGKWEMIYEQQISDGGFLEYLLTGQWKMKKKEN